MVQSGYVELVKDVISVMAANYDLWGVCAVYFAKTYKTLHTYHRALSYTWGTVDYSAVFPKDNAETFLSFPFDT